jgi:hypothetical protein
LFFFAIFAPLMRAIHGAHPAGALKRVQFYSRQNCAVNDF